MHNSLKYARTEKRKIIKKAESSKDKKTAKEILNHINGGNKKEDILDFLYRARTDNAIEEAVKKDKKYQEVNKKAHRKICKIERIKFNSEQWKIVDEALSVNNEICSEYGRVAYYQGVKDTVSLLAEIYSSLQLK